jgi:hypothetical protein
MDFFVEWEMNAFFGDFINKILPNQFFGDFSFKKYLFFRNSDIFREFSFDKALIPQKFRHFSGFLTKCNLVLQNEFLVQQNAI